MLTREKMIEHVLDSTTQQAERIRELTDKPNVRVAAMNIQANVIMLKSLLKGDETK